MKPVAHRSQKAYKPSTIQQYSGLSKYEYYTCVRVLSSSIPKNENSVYATYTEGDLLAFICIRYLIAVKRLGFNLLVQVRPSISDLFEICQHDFEQLCGWKLTFYSPNPKSLEWMKFNRSGYNDPETKHIDPEDLFVVELRKMVDLLKRSLDKDSTNSAPNRIDADSELSKLAKKIESSVQNRR